MKSLRDSISKSALQPLFGKHKSILGLDGVRALCAIAVVANHSSLGNDGIGNMAVRIFFVLSGFLIFPILFRARRRIETGASTILTEGWIFLADRALRILPVYYGILLLVFLYGQVSPTSFAYLNLLRGWPWFVTYLSSSYFEFTPDYWQQPWGHFWSPAIEQQFYFLIAPLFLFLPSRWWKYMLLAGAVAAALWLTAPYTPKPFWLFTTKNSCLGFYPLCLGGAAGLLDKDILPERFRSFMGVAPAALLCAMTLSGLAESSYLYQVVNFLLAPLAAVFMLIAVRQFPETGLVRTLEIPPLRALGIISYGFYVFHLIVLEHIRHFFESQFPAPTSRWDNFPLFALTIGITLVLATVSYLFYERPFLKLKPKKPATPVTASRAEAI